MERDDGREMVQIKGEGTLTKVEGDGKCVSLLSRHDRAKRGKRSSKRGRVGSLRSTCM